MDLQERRGEAFVNDKSIKIYDNYNLAMGETENH